MFVQRTGECITVYVVLSPWIQAGYDPGITGPQLIFSQTEGISWGSGENLKIIQMDAFVLMHCSFAFTAP